MSITDPPDKSAFPLLLNVCEDESDAFPEANRCWEIV